MSKVSSSVGPLGSPAAFASKESLVGAAASSSEPAAAEASSAAPGPEAEASDSMLLEVESASRFLAHLVTLGRTSLSEPQLAQLKRALLEVLRLRYRDHWFPDKPHKGSGYRCIRINGKLDPVVEAAAVRCGLSALVLKSTFPPELTIWVDPGEVSYRIGENGSICVLFDATHKEPWKPAARQGRPAPGPVVPTDTSSMKKTPQKKIEEQVRRASAHLPPALTPLLNVSCSFPPDCGLQGDPPSSARHQERRADSGPVARQRQGPTDRLGTIHHSVRHHFIFQINTY